VLSSLILPRPFVDGMVGTGQPLQASYRSELSCGGKCNLKKKLGTGRSSKCSVGLQLVETKKRPVSRFC
jgi:hypothetical protein